MSHNWSNSYLIVLLALVGVEQKPEQTGFNSSHICSFSGCVTSSLKSRCFQEDKLELFTFGRVHVQIQAPWETSNQRAHHLSQVSCTQPPVQRWSRLTLTSPLSLALLCRPHREAIELHSRPCDSQPPLRAALRSRSVCWPCRAVETVWRTNKCCCLAGQLRGSPVFVEWGPLRSGFPFRVPGTVPRLCWRWLASTRRAAFKARQTEKCAHCLKLWADCPLIIPGP